MINNWARQLLKRIIENQDLIKLYFIPGLLFFLDFIVRSVLGMDLIDTGADMALLAVVTFITLLIEDVSPQQKYNIVKLIFIILFMATWILSLKIAANESPWLLLSIDFRLIISWFIGLFSFVFSGIMASAIIVDTKNQGA